jgi:riboflavin synthase
VTVDGVSLTVVAPRGGRFEAALVPETLRRTTLGQAAPQDSVHLEADLVGKWIERLLAERV